MDKLIDSQTGSYARSLKCGKAITGGEAMKASLIQDHIIKHFNTAPPLLSKPLVEVMCIFKDTIMVLVKD